MPEPFKNQISPQLVACLSDQLARRLPGFDRASFEAPILLQLDALELKDRARLIAEKLHEVLPADTGSRNAILLAMLHPMASGESGQSDAQGIRGWGMMPLGMVVSQYGLADFDASMALLKEMTRRFSSEFDVRYFLLADQPRALAIMRDWVSDPDPHVRRLVSEGTRPRLPWGVQLPLLIADPAPVIPLLCELRDDPQPYVRRSVANHLNDIAKDHPDRVAALCVRWLRDAPSERVAMLSHACRGLIKQGRADVLQAFGYSAPAIATPALHITTPVVHFGDALEFTLELHSTARTEQDLVIDYLLHFMKANGRQVAKVFKWKRLRIAAGQRLLLHRRHAIRPITTRRYYAGEQALSVRINGQDYGDASFELLMDAGD